MWMGVFKVWKSIGIIIRTIRNVFNGEFDETYLLIYFSLKLVYKMDITTKSLQIFWRCFVSILTTGLHHIQRPKWFRDFNIQLSDEYIKSSKIHELGYGKIPEKKCRKVQESVPKCSEQSIGSVMKVQQVQQTKDSKGQSVQPKCSENVVHMH